MAESWKADVRFSELGRGPVSRRLVADEEARRRIALELGLEAILEFAAQVTAKPWHDGAEVEGDWSATITQICSGTADPFDSELAGRFTVRVLPPASANAPEEAAEIAVDPDAEDPPDVAGSDQIDLAAYVVEHLALEIDPFPRKPGAVFTPPEEPEEMSPFAVLRQFKPRGEDG